MKDVSCRARIPLRVALLSPEMMTSGGVQTYMLDLVSAFSRSGDTQSEATCDILSLNDSSQSLSELAALPRCTSAIGTGRSKLRFFYHALKHANKWDVAIVGHIGLAPAAWILKKLGLLKRYILVLHGIEAWKPASFLDRIAASSASAVVSTTHHTIRTFSSVNSLHHLRYLKIPLSVKESKSTRGTESFLRGDPKILCVARQDITEKDKGFEPLLEALSRLLVDFPAAHLNLVGPAKDRSWLVQLAKEHRVEDAVTFWGGLTRRQLEDAYADCDFFAMPSKKEGFGIVFLEAMRFGKPCIGGAHGGTPEVIEDNQSGFLCQYGDVDSLTDRMARLSGDTSLRTALGARSAQLVSSRYNFSLFQSSWLAAANNVY